KATPYLFAALKGQLDKLVEAEKQGIDTRFLYVMAVSNGHFKALDSLIVSRSSEEALVENASSLRRPVSRLEWAFDIAVDLGNLNVINKLWEYIPPWKRNSRFLKALQKGHQKVIRKICESPDVEYYYLIKGGLLDAINEKRPERVKLLLPYINAKNVE